MASMFDLFSSLFDPHGRYQAEEMVTFQESEKTNHHPNYISKTTQFSTAFCFKRILDDPIGEPKPNSADPWDFKGYVIKDIDIKDSGKRRSKTDSLAVKELKKYRRDGFTKIRLRDLSYRAKEYLGFLPPTNKNDREEYVTYSDAPSPSSTHAAQPTTFWGTPAPTSTLAATATALWDIPTPSSTAATATTYWDALPPSSTAAKAATFWDAPAAANATTYFGTIYWEVETIVKSFDELPEDMIQTILAKLPTKDIYHGRSVCKAWDSIITTELSFRSAFNESSNEYSFHRRPWFLLLDTKNSSLELRPEAVYDMEADAPGSWCQIKIKIPVPTTRTTTTRTHNVIISSGGLMCVWSGSNNFIVSNPFTGSSHRLPLLSNTDGDHYFKGMAMHVLPYSKTSGRLSYQVFVLVAKKSDARVLRIKTYASSLTDQEHGYWKEILKMDLDPSKTGRISGVTTIGREKQILLYFISGDGFKAISYDIRSGTVCMTSKFLPPLQSCKASQLVVCDGTLFAVILSGDIGQPVFAPNQLQIFESSGDEIMSENAIWRHVTTMPGRIPQKYDTISCAGCGDYIMVYVTCASSEFATPSNYAVMFNKKEKAWVLLQSQRSPSGHTGRTYKMEIHALKPTIG